MQPLIFINLPVRDLAASIAFYEALEFRRNPQFSDETAACILVSDVIHVMLLTHAKFMQFSPRPIADARASAQALFCLSAESRAAVDERVARATQAGGAGDPTPTQEFGVMYGRSYEDPDGHIWEVMWMDPAAVAGEPASS
ncbi:lactoylglutathione lyase [Aureimonas ureilytica]|uniref:Lactoylglutathione lyase n=1 Tax=Aureimonas ureilytica TaxID=401562 RepID=A0A175R5V6_9HYPH|nr:VOC family protein [Aureimonas ureilytica]KTQ94061.1 lactoylglutathione lyase [Aureimonas ureilytica]